MQQEFLQACKSPEPCTLFENSAHPALPTNHLRRSLGMYLYGTLYFRSICIPGQKRADYWNEISNVQTQMVGEAS